MRRSFVLLVPFLLLVLTLPWLAAAQTLPPVDPAQSSGTILTAGAPSLIALSRGIATTFGTDGFPGSVVVEESTTASAFERFCAGELDIVLADRQVNELETDACVANGRAPLPFRVATDAVVIAVGLSNTFVDNLTTEELQAVFGAALNWSDVRPEWPAQPINRVGPATTSEEFALFANAVFGGESRELATAFNSQFTDDPSLVVQALSNSALHIGFLDAEFANRNTGTLRLVPVDNLQPTAGNLQSARYPLTRPLYLYSAASVLQEKPSVADFINYYLTNVNAQVSVAGLYSASAEQQAAAASTWFDAVGQAPPPTETPVIEATPTLEVLATTTPAPAAVFPEGVLPILVSARTDLETLATELLGTERVAGWSGSLNVNDPQLGLLIRIDLELLAAVVYGTDNRPSEWFGVVPSSQLALARDIRHDLEVLADAVYGGPASRPTTWSGDNPLYRCSRSTQALVNLLSRNGVGLDVNPAQENYCTQIEQEAARYAEVNWLSESPLAPLPTGGDGEGAIPAGSAQVETNLAVAFLTRNATTRVGLMPNGTVIVPVARSYTEFSNMLLVEGDGFLVFIDWQNTSLTEDEFDALPDESGIGQQTFCTAEWCS